MNILETNNLTFRYKKHPVLENINLNIPEGSIYGYLGRNGEGKSTTIKILLGLEKVPEDVVFFYGKEFNANRLDVISEIGCLIEQPFFYSDLSAYENLRYLDILYKCGENRIQYVLDLVKLTKHQCKKVKHYSTGMKQRLGIAIAIFHDPKLLILDEPLNGLDPEGVYEMRDLMIKLQNEGKTIFISGHILAELEKICTHIGILNNKRLLFQGEIRELLADTDNEVLIKTDDHERCISICIEHAIHVQLTSDGLLSVKMDNRISLNSFLQLLEQNQIKILSIQNKKQDLESVFLNLITTDL